MENIKAKELKIRIDFAPILVTTDGKEVFEYLYKLDRNKSEYIAKALTFYTNYCDNEILKIKDIVDSIKYLVNEYQIKYKKDLKILLLSDIKNPSNTPPIKRTMFALQFNKDYVEHNSAYNLLVDLKNSSQRAGIITKAVKCYQAANNDPYARKQRAEMLLYKVSLYYKNSNKEMKKYIENWIYPFFLDA